LATGNQPSFEAEDVGEDRPTRPELAPVRSRRIAIGLGATLLALAALVAWAAARLEDQPPAQSIDPHHVGVAVAGAVAAGSCIVALWQLRQATRGRSGSLVAWVSIALAVAALVIVVAVAFASRLGG
jgi:amino acid permease